MIISNLLLGYFFNKLFYTMFPYFACKREKFVTIKIAKFCSGKFFEYFCESFNEGRVVVRAEDFEMNESSFTPLIYVTTRRLENSSSCV